MAGHCLRALLSALCVLLPARAALADDTLERARAVLAAGDAKEAYRLAQEAVAADKTAAPALHILGLAAFRAGLYEAALGAFKDELAHTTPSSPAARTATFNLAGAEYQLHRYGEAVQAFRRAAHPATSDAGEDALSALANYNAGIAAEDGGDVRTAIELYLLAARSSAAGKSVVSDARHRADDLVAAGRREAREAAWTAARTATAELRAGKAAEAVAQLDHALERARAAGMTAAERADMEYAYGHALLTANRVGEASQAFGRAVSAVPTDPEYHYMLGLSLYRLDGGGERQSGATAAGEFQAAIAAGLPERDAERAREYLAALRTAPAR